MEKILRVVTPYYVAGAVFVLDERGWCCTRAAPILKWAIGKSPLYVLEYLKKKGWKYEWLDP